MVQNEFFQDAQKEDEATFHVGYRLYIKFKDKSKSKADLYHNETWVKTVDLSDSVAKRLFIVEAVELGARQTRLADALNLSRQTIHNYLQTKKHFGLEGLIRNYSPSKNLREQREEAIGTSHTGNKARQLEQIRKEQRQNQESQIRLPFGDKEIEPEDQPFTEEHDWQATRYAGVFPYLITLIHTNNWLKLTSSYLGEKYKLLLTFLLMISHNVRSIEQLKNLHKREGGIILGIRQLPGKTKARIWLYSSCKLRTACALLTHFFTAQIRNGLVGTWLWFVDGHLLPYTGKTKVHQAFNTQRSMMVPGRNNIVACDADGKVVDFKIHEGKGDIRAYLIELGKKWKEEIVAGPVMVFDREAYGADFFYEMSQAGIDFVTWDKHVDTKKLKELADDRFKFEFELNGKTYKVFEDEKEFTHSVDGKTDEVFTLRRIYIWNVSCNRRTCALANVMVEKMNESDCAKAILTRWAASENTFKHLGDKHPLNYQPGYSFTESPKQEIENPEIKEIKKKASGIKSKLSKLYKKLSKTKEVLNKDGSVRKNSSYQKISAQIEEKEAEVVLLKQEADKLPERVDISLLEDYNCFQAICDESKYLFDFVTSSVWNARKHMTDWLLPLYENKNEYVDLFYAITNCHGWIKSEADKVTVRIEPLQQPSRLSAQQQFCRKLNQLKVITPTGKLLEIEVGNSPLT